MPLCTETAFEHEGLAEIDEDVSPDMWERLWDEWQPFPAMVAEER